MGLKAVGGLRDICGELSADTPSPGGGSASAASGAMGASLLVMACGLALKRKDAMGRDELITLKSRLEGLRDRLVRLSNEDAESFDRVMDAVRRKREKDDEGSRRAFQDAVKHAAEIPLETAEACAEALEHARAVSGLALKSTTSDFAVGVLLLDAGLKGATMNVRINLKDIEDKAFIASARRRMDERSQKARAAFEAVMAVVDERLAR